MLTPMFDRPVPLDGYAWWYLDALSDDGAIGLTVIAFIGSVFSPYYAFRRRRAPTDPHEHCAINAVLYAARAHWAMTERSQSALHRTANELVIGPSTLRCNGSVLDIDLDERTFPLPGSIRGRIRIHASAINDRCFALDSGARHHWHPMAPSVRTEIDLQHPALRFSGTGYFDTNYGDEPLERRFAGWQWSRAHLKDGSTAILYDVDQRSGGGASLALKFAPNRPIESFQAPPPAAVDRTYWGIGRTTRSDDGARVLRTLENAPFYARSVVQTHLLGERVAAVHESLSLDRFALRPVQALLPFRMPRRS